MGGKLDELERKRMDIYRRLSLVGDFRRGTISEGYRKCGKKNCACTHPDHPGHGPRYVWSSTRAGGRSVARNLPLGPELEKATREQSNYREFLRLSQQLIEINEQLCDLREVRQIAGGAELEALKKKLRRKYARRRKARSGG